MSPESPTTRQENSQTLARLILARTSWVQRALSPWVQRWLAAPLTTFGRGPGRSASIGLRPWTQGGTALAVANTQWLVKRVQRIAERRALSPFAATAPATELPLVGIRPGTPAAEPTPEPTSDAPASNLAPGFMPFDSFTDFVKAVEEARTRQYHAERDTPASNLAPDSRVGREANASERARQPRLSASARQLPPSRKQGPYSKRFTSFADFTKALEETRQRESQLAAQPPAPSTAAQDVARQAPAAKIRPVSRIEELPPHISTVPDQVPALGAERAAELSDESSQVEPHAAPLLTKPAEALEHYPAAEPPLDTGVEARGETPSPAPQIISRERPDQPAIEAVTKERPTMPRAVPPHARAEPPSSTGQVTGAITLPPPGPAAPQAPRFAAQPAPTPAAPAVQRQAIAPAQPDVAPQAPAPIEPEIGTLPVRHETPPMAAPLEQQAAEVEPTTGPQTPAPAELPVETLFPRPLLQRQAVEARPAPRPDAAKSRAAMTGAQTPTPVEPVEPQIETQPIRREIPRFAAPPEPQAVEAQPVPQSSAAAETPVEPQPVRRETPGSATLSERRAAEVEPIEPPIEPPPWPSATPPPVLRVQRQAAEAEPIEPSIELPLPSPLRGVLGTMPPLTRPAAQIEPLGAERAQPASRPRTPSEQVAEAEPAQQPPATTAPSVELPLPSTTPPIRPAAQVERPASRAPSEQVAEVEPAPQPTAVTESRIEPPSPSTTLLAPQVQRQVAETEPAPQLTAATEPAVELPLPSPLRGGLGTMPALTRPDTQIEQPAPRVQRQAAKAEASEPPIELPSPSPLGGVLGTMPPLARPDAPIEQPAPRVQRQAAEAEPIEPIVGPPIELPSPSMPPLTRPTLRPGAAIESRVAGHGAGAEISSVQPKAQIEQPLAPKPAAEPPSSDWPDFTLGTQVFARRAASQRLTTTPLPDLPLKHAPLAQQPAAQPGGVTSAITPASPPAISAAPASGGGAAAVIQRMPIETPAIPSAIPSGEGFIQRVETTPPQATVPIQAQQQNLDDLARKIYPLIKRMLAVERERRAF